MNKTEFANTLLELANHLLANSTSGAKDENNTAESSDESEKTVSIAESDSNTELASKLTEVLELLKNQQTTPRTNDATKKTPPITPTPKAQTQQKNDSFSPQEAAEFFKSWV